MLWTFPGKRAACMGTALFRDHASLHLLSKHSQAAWMVGHGNRQHRGHCGPTCMDSRSQTEMLLSKRTMTPTLPSPEAANDFTRLPWCPARRIKIHAQATRFGSQRVATFHSAAKPLAGVPQMGTIQPSQK